MPDDAIRINADIVRHDRIPSYLQETYWWAYVHPNAVYLFERQWLVNLILWGNFARLRDAALNELGSEINGRILQVACVYGDFSNKLAARLSNDASLDVVDVLPVQLSNLRAKLPANARVTPCLRNSIDLGFSDATYDQTVLFFLLHEQPEAVRRQTPMNGTPRMSRAYVGDGTAFVAAMNIGQYIVGVAWCIRDPPIG